MQFRSGGALAHKSSSRAAATHAMLATGAHGADVVDVNVVLLLRAYAEHTAQLCGCNL